jgi:hypothetical protein
VLYQNDDYGKDYLKGLKDGLGEDGRCWPMPRACMEFPGQQPCFATHRPT